MVEAGLDFFFDMIKWVFTDFLIKIKILNVSLLYYFLAIILLGIIIGALINPVSAGNWVHWSSGYNERRQSEETHARRVLEAQKRRQNRHASRMKARYNNDVYR